MDFIVSVLVNVAAQLIALFGDKPEKPQELVRLIIG